MRYKQAVWISRELDFKITGFEEKYTIKICNNFSSLNNTERM